MPPKGEVYTDKLTDAERQELFDMFSRLDYQGDGARQDSVQHTV